jgi:hypothetical protein
MSRKFALVIGNSLYQDPTLARLKSPEADVHALAVTLRDPNIGAFDEVQELLNEKESKIRRAISTFFAGKKPDDLLLLFFSGHGVLDPQGRLFLAVRDTQRDLLKATSIPAAFITDDMDSCRSKRQVLILDCCHSGAFARGAKGEMSAVTRATFEGNGYGRVVLTASDSTQYALEGEQSEQVAALSLFTNYLLEGLVSGEADRGGDGWVAVDEWYDYTYEKVLSHTPNQTPKKWAYNTQGDLVIAKNPKPRPQEPIELPRYLRTAIESELPRVRLDMIEELENLLKGGRPGMASAAMDALKHMAGTDDSYNVRLRASRVLAAHPEALPASGEEPAPIERQPGKDAIEENEQAVPVPQDSEWVHQAKEQAEITDYKHVDIQTARIDRQLEQQAGPEQAARPLAGASSPYLPVIIAALGAGITLGLHYPPGIFAGVFISSGIVFSIWASGIPLALEQLAVLFLAWFLPHLLIEPLFSLAYEETGLEWTIVYISYLVIVTATALLLRAYVPGIRGKSIWGGMAFALTVVFSILLSEGLLGDWVEFSFMHGFLGFVFGAAGGGWMLRELRRAYPAEMVHPRKWDFTGWQSQLERLVAKVATSIKRPDIPGSSPTFPQASTDSPPAVQTVRQRWLPALLLALGWAAGLLLLLDLLVKGSGLAGPVGALAVASSLVLSLRAAGLNMISRVRLIQLFIVWLASLSIVLYILTYLLWNSLDLAFLYLLLLIVLAAVFVGTALLLRKSIPGVSWLPVLGGWVLGFILGTAAAAAMILVWESRDLSNTKMFIGAGGFLAGGTGGYLMYRHIRRALAKTSETTSLV